MSRYVRIILIFKEKRGCKVTVLILGYINGYVTDDIGLDFNCQRLSM
jgi:hypothetical protein